MHTTLITILGILTINLSLNTIVSAIECHDQSQTPVQRLHPFPSSNGCSKPMGLEVQGEEDFTYCCDRHDACYATCGIDKEFCEKDFKACMTELCNESFSYNNQCEAAAALYQVGTTMFGGTGYKESQDSHCECVNEEKAWMRYKNLFTQIYLKHSNKRSEDIQEALTNMENKLGPHPPVSKLSMLFYRMLKKYDSAIEHVDGRVWMNPPKPGQDEL